MATLINGRQKGVWEGGGGIQELEFIVGLSLSDAVIETRSKDAAFPLLCMILFIVPERRRLEQARVAKHKPAPAATAGKPGHNLSPSALSNLPALPPFSPLLHLLREEEGELGFPFFFSPFSCFLFSSPPLPPK